MKTGFLEQSIENRKRNNQYRSLRNIELVGDVELIYEGKKFVNFSSNNYLGLAGDLILKQKAIEFVNRYGTGATASRLICGNHPYHIQVEDHIAQLAGVEAALLFSSGYQANLTLLPALADRHSLIFADKHIHNSLLQGAIASRAKITRYSHNDLTHLEQLLKRHREEERRKWIVTESIFSMDGDQSNIEALVELSEKYSCLLYLDDAHATGLAGRNGMGLAFGKKKPDVAVGAFGKAGGGSGAFAACSKKMKEYLIQYCGGIIYSTAISPAIVGAIEGALERFPTLDSERSRLRTIAEYVRCEISKMGFNIGSSTTHIIPLIVGSEDLAIRLAEKLESCGIFAMAIRPPTVPGEASCVRLSLSSKHTDNQITHLLTTLSRWHEKC